MEKVIINNSLVAEGFAVKLTPKSASFEAGFCQGKEFEAFSFELEGVEDVDTLYEVYLTMDGVQVERFELTPEATPYYTGTSELLHLLSTIIVEPKGAVSGKVFLSKEE